MSGRAKIMVRYGVLALTVWTSLGASRSDDLTRFTFTQYHMGIDAQIILYAPDKETAEAAAIAAYKRIAELDWIMSDYRGDSELMRLCARGGGFPVRVSRDLFKVLERAQEVSERSNGAFDVTVGPFVQLWRKVRRTRVLPSPEALSEAKRLVGWRKLHLDKWERTVRLDKKGMLLDLGGIAKGYAADAMHRVLKNHGVNSALIQLGGDIVVSDPPPNSDGWMIRVPIVGGDIPFRNCAVSTSGDTVQFVEIEGKRYSHVVDPRSGMALTNRVQATIVGKDGLTTDPVSTAVTVMGDDFRALVRSYGVRAWIKVEP